MNRFFIIGNPRSGTTLFRLMLNKHSQICVPPEAGFLIWMQQEFNDHTFNTNYDDFIRSLLKTKKIESWNIDQTELSAFLKVKRPSSYGQVMDCVYQYYARKRDKESSLLGDKNNYYLNHILDIHKLYSNAKFIHIIRDGRSVAVSYLQLMEQKLDSLYAPKLPKEISQIANEWLDNILTIESSFELLPRSSYTTIRYEDLVINPIETLSKVCDFLNANFEENMLEYYKTTVSEGLEPNEYLAWKQKNMNPLMVEEVKKYELLSIEHQSVFIDIAKNTLAKYYEWE